MSVWHWQAETNADGSSADEVASWCERTAAELDVAAAQEAVQRDEQVRSSNLFNATT